MALGILYFNALINAELILLCINVLGKNFIHFQMLESTACKVVAQVCNEASVVRGSECKKKDCIHKCTLHIFL